MVATGDEAMIASDVAFGSWLCENSEIEISHRKFVSTSSILKNANAYEDCREKTIEKTILRVPRARTFLHSLGQTHHICDVRVVSAFPPIATNIMAQTLWRDTL
jgi:hypothetical protein